MRGSGLVRVGLLCGTLLLATGGQYYRTPSLEQPGAAPTARNNRPAVQQPPPTAIGCAVIAPTVELSAMARIGFASGRYVEMPPKQAAVVVVLVRSILPDPLRYRYDCYCELRKDAERQLNLVTSYKLHLYLFAINNDLSVTQTSHQAP